MNKLIHPNVIGSARNRFIYAALAPVAAAMRKEPTVAEKILWNELRSKKLGIKFRRQHVIDRFIVDFYCVGIGLVIEVKGKIHEKQRGADKEREQILKVLGCTVIDFSNQDVEEKLDEVIRKIKVKIHFLSR